MNELIPFQESVFNKDEQTFLESKTIMVEDPKMVAAVFWGDDEFYKEKLISFMTNYYLSSC